MSLCVDHKIQRIAFLPSHPPEFAVTVNPPLGTGLTAARSGTELCNSSHKVWDRLRQDYFPTTAQHFSDKDFNGSYSVCRRTYIHTCICI